MLACRQFSVTIPVGAETVTPADEAAILTPVLSWAVIPVASMVILLPSAILAVRLCGVS